MDYSCEILDDAHMQRELEQCFNELRPVYNCKCKLLSLSYLGDCALWDGCIKIVFRKMFQYATLIHCILDDLVKYNRSWTADGRHDIIFSSSMRQKFWDGWGNKKLVQTQNSIFLIILDHTTMQMKVFSLWALDIMEPIMQSITVKIELITIRNKNIKTTKSNLFFFFHYQEFYCKLGAPEL